MAKIKVELDGKTLREAKEVAGKLGLDLESVTKAFYRQIVREQRIPLSFSLQQTQAPTAVASDVMAPEPSQVANGAHTSSESVREPEAAVSTPNQAQADSATDAAKPTDVRQQEASPADTSEANRTEDAAPANGSSIPPLSSIPTEDELMERMIAARDAAEEERQNAEAVKRDAERRAKMQAEMDRAFDEAAAKRKAAAEVPEHPQQEQVRPQVQPAGEISATGASDPSQAADDGADQEQADDAARRLAEAFAAVRAGASPSAAKHVGKEHGEQPLTIDEDGTKHGGWRDSWLFEDDDPDDELLFSPLEI